MTTVTFLGGYMDRQTGIGSLCRAYRDAAEDHDHAVTYGYDPKADLAVVPTLSQESPQQVSWAKDHDIPHLVLAHGTEVLSRVNRDDHLVSRFLESRRLRKTYEDAALVVANSQYTKGLLEAAGVPEDRTAVVHPTTRNPLEDIPPPDERHGLVFLGSLKPRKNPKQVLRLAAHLEEPVRFIGTGPEHLDLLNLRDRLLVHHDLETKHHGKVTDAERDRILSKAEVLVGPSRRDGSDVEGYGISYRDALACGTPVVATRSGGVPEAVPDDVGNLVPTPPKLRHLTTATHNLLRRMRRPGGDLPFRCAQTVQEEPFRPTPFLDLLDHPPT